MRKRKRTIIQRTPPREHPPELQPFHTPIVAPNGDPLFFAKSGRPAMPKWMIATAPEPGGLAARMHQKFENGPILLTASGNLAAEATP